MPRMPCRHQLTARMKTQVCINAAATAERGCNGNVLRLGTLKVIAMRKILNH